MNNSKWSPGDWYVFWANGNEVCLGCDSKRLTVPMSLNYSNGGCGPNYNAKLIASSKDLHEVAFSIEQALLGGFDASEILDENSPIRAALSAALKKSGVYPE